MHSVLYLEIKFFVKEGIYSFKLVLTASKVFLVKILHELAIHIKSKMHKMW